MSWYWWILIYVAGWMITFRTVYLRHTEATQRAIASNRHIELSKRSHDSPEWHVNQWKEGDQLAATFQAFLWFLVLPYFLGKFIMFPRGIRTKFDREQELEREKKEAEQKFNEARALLAKEGIKI